MLMQILTDKAQHCLCMPEQINPDNHDPIMLAFSIVNITNFRKFDYLYLRQCFFADTRLPRFSS